MHGFDMRLAKRTRTMKSTVSISTLLIFLTSLPAAAVGLDPVSIPVPGTIPLLASGMAVGLAIYLRNRRK